MPFPTEFKESIAARALSGEATARELAEQHNVSISSVKNWVRAAKDKAAGRTNVKAHKMPKTQRPPMPKGWTVKRAHEAVCARKLFGVDSEEYGAYCRSNGVLDSDVTAMEEWFGKRDLVDGGSAETLVSWISGRMARWRHSPDEEVSSTPPISRSLSYAGLISQLSCARLVGDGPHNYRLD